ncbi:hypothetical protein V2A60_002595 [Cordyceps javanica]|uniref:Protein kinase-like domain n=1 Tax=Cordyceps javanica TaxID=43265 RepID=A0A545UY47_9HYPO|nr:Protein kinase-like domain [Cordyceps javanica]TQW06243.1 Protein kinase-like domain [Cordyceps javanica]
MVFVFLVSRLARWENAMQYLRRLCRWLFPDRLLDDVQPCDDESPVTRCVSKLDRDARRQAYVDAIDDIDVLGLASSYNMGKRCEEFGQRTRGSFNLCVFVVFPDDGSKWVVRFPICPLLHEPWRKLQSEVATLEFIRAKTTIPVPEVKGHGQGAGLHPKSRANFPFIILEYISGRPLEYREILDRPTDDLRPLFAELGECLSQLRAHEFQYGGALVKDGADGYAIAAPNSVVLNSLQLRGTQRHVERHATALDFALCHYEALYQSQILPSEETDESEAQLVMFALQDFKLRLCHFIDPKLNLEPFILSHGDLRPPNIIVNEDLSLAGIIDWEWSGTVPLQFFTPPLWLAGIDATYPGDAKYRARYPVLHGSLLDASKDATASRKLANEWGPDLSSSLRLFLPSALLRSDLFVSIYYMALFREYYKDSKRDDMLKELYDSCSKFREMVNKMMEKSDSDMPRLE